MVARVSTAQVNLAYRLQHRGSVKHTSGSPRLVHPSRRRDSSEQRLGLHIPSGSNGSAPENLDYNTAIQFLGLRDGATSEEMIRARNVMLARYQEDDENRVKVEAAYDVLLMQSFLRRTKGEVSDRSVEYADVSRPKVASGGQNLPPWARGALQNIPQRPMLDTPNSVTISTNAAAFGALAAWILAQGVTQMPGVDNPPGLQISLAFGGALWLLQKKKNVSIGRAALLSTLALLIGCTAGGLIEGWLRVDIVPLGPLSSPAALVSEFGIVGFFVAATFLC